MIPLLIFKSIFSKSLFYGLTTGGGIAAAEQSFSNNDHTQLLLGLFPLIGVIFVGVLTAVVNLKVASKNSGVDMKEHRRLIKENKQKDKIIEALTKKVEEGE